MSVKLTYEFIKEQIESQGYKLLSDTYVNATTKLSIQCPQGHEFDMAWNNFYNIGNRCPVCSGKKKHTIEEVKEFIENKGYKLLSKEYINNSTKLNMICDKGHTFNMSYNSFQRGNRCPVCNNLYGYKNIKNTIKEVKEYIESQNYKLLSKEYINNSTKLSIRCTNGHKFNMTYNDFKDGHRCPRCNNKSKGEETIKIVLDNYKICYQTQKRFDDCKYKQHLPFDFYLPNYNLCIEYDGIQHFKPIMFSGYNKEEDDIKRFEYTQQNDQIKDDYCKQNGIKLIRISYTEFDNIENILIKELNLKKPIDNILNK